MDKYLNEVMDSINKSCTDAELKQLNLLKKCMRFVTVFDGIFNVNLLKRIFFSREFKTARWQTIEFERESQQFILNGYVTKNI